MKEKKESTKLKHAIINVGNQRSLLERNLHFWKSRTSVDDAVEWLRKIVAGVYSGEASNHACFMEQKEIECNKGSQLNPDSISIPKNKDEFFEEVLDPMVFQAKLNLCFGASVFACDFCMGDDDWEKKVQTFKANYESCKIVNDLVIEVQRLSGSVPGSFKKFYEVMAKHDIGKPELLEVK